MAFTFRRNKAEFKPDSKRFDLAQRLYLSPQQQKKYLKWILFSLLSLLMLVLQDVLFSRISIYGATVDMVPCVLLLICVLQGAAEGRPANMLSSLDAVFTSCASDRWV